MEKNAIGTDRQTLQLEDPSWCAHHEHRVEDHPDDEVTVHYGRTATVSTWEDDYTVQVIRYDFTVTSSGPQTDDLAVLLDGASLRPTEAVALGEALILAARQSGGLES
ncbi:hypothetical protein O2W18_04440 [Modestobacter sp. VKM Ac-2983]|uniref:hypothetical protein n=1 Tax=Modestobacter sp. VKM Ac-2983 TaxID=3004137 RepID=UPI0022AB8728|nr:hypothetical protein [Modestobacter sp. VKM Ac-2983]MCZ2804342.1 hypothetical protein [Modestobacter sp. VKM Ac-2983]